ncbi:hypothetical protein [Puniceibacterium sediminis]|uniref:Uncharacterized protein n=1 Tax=Puniceibacterium sediminis TaxID=1608407 RepID=A0A238VJ82_9RHOB|nr:hypothetical protein [Puniceibacterium sediminis]SNR33569.1 hypothetical protein SAMN06265370_102151 [Puniceibacterium sediminis]
MSRQIRSLIVDRSSVEGFTPKALAFNTPTWRNRDAYAKLRETADFRAVSDKLFDRLDAQLDAKIGTTPDATDRMDLVVFQGKNFGLAPVFDRIGDNFLSAEVYRSRVLAFRAASLRVGHKTVFAVDYDALGPADRALPKLTHLRKMNPLLTVVLLSERFHRDDLSGKREGIADASVRLPASASSIMRGIGYAVNNARRRHDL